MKHLRVLTARDVMARHLFTLRPDMKLFDAMGILLRRQISGAPVVDPRGTLLGILSELDCMRVLASGEFHHDDHYEEALVSQYMSKPDHTVAPDTGLYRVAHIFLDKAVRRLPVVENGELIGQVSRRDVLRGIEQMRRQRQPRRKRYPDYPEERRPML